jgi:cell division septation protein DedD
MDQHLKQRLIGVTIAVALVVIFVPMLFEKSDDKGKLATTGIPPIPDEVMEKPLDLPKTAADLAVIEKEKQQALEKAQAKEAKETGKKPSTESTYKIVPLNEEAAPSKAEAEAGKSAGAEDSGEETAESTGGEEEGASANENTPQPTAPSKVPALVAPLVRPLVESKPTAPKATTTLAPKIAPAPHAAVNHDKPASPVHPHVNKVPTPPPSPKPAAVAPAKAPNIAAKKLEPAKKIETAKPVESHPHVIKTVKVNRPKPVATPTAHDADDEGEPIPTPAPAKTPVPVVAKPKPPTPVVTAKPAQPVVVAKKPIATTKPAEPHPHPPTTGTTEPTATPPTKAASKPAEHAKAHAHVKKPTTWVIQAGSFSDEVAAKGLAEKLKQSKLPASVQAAHGEHGTVYRVQVGSSHDRSHAEETLKQMQGSTGVNGIITPHH